MSNSTDQAAPADLDARSAAATVEQLEQEGDVAADYLEGLLDIADIDGDLTLDVRAGRAYVSVENDDEDALTLLAEIEGVSKQEATVRAIREAVARRMRRDKVAALSDAARERYADLLERLGR